MRSLRAWQVVPAGTEGFEKAEVTAGGVDTAELSSQTMEARKRPGLYFIGEVVDVTGHLGGFNFQWEAFVDGPHSQPCLQLAGIDYSQSRRLAMSINLAPLRGL